MLYKIRFLPLIFVVEVTLYCTLEIWSKHQESYAVPVESPLFDNRFTIEITHTHLFSATSAFTDQFTFIFHFFIFYFSFFTLYFLSYRFNYFFLDRCM